MQTTKVHKLAREKDLKDLQIMDLSHSCRSTSEEICKSRELKTLQILDAELDSLSKTARVYIQQANSRVFFLSNVEKARQDTKVKIAELCGQQLKA